MTARALTRARLIATATEVALSDVHVSLPGEVVSYDAETQRATVRPMVKRPIKSPRTTMMETLPDIPNAVVCWPRSSGFGLHCKLAKGDSVVLVFSEQSYSEWRQTGKVSTPFLIRRHSIGYPFVIPGAFPDASPLGTLAGGDGMRLGKDNSDEQIHIDGDGFVKIGAGATDFIALKSLVEGELNKIKLAFAAATAPPGGGAVTYGLAAYTTVGNTGAAKGKAK